MCVYLDNVCAHVVCVCMFDMCVCEWRIGTRLRCNLYRMMLVPYWATFQCLMNDLNAIR